MKRNIIMLGCLVGVMCLSACSSSSSSNKESVRKVNYEVKGASFNVLSSNSIITAIPNEAAWHEVQTSFKSEEISSNENTIYTFKLRIKDGATNRYKTKEELDTLVNTLESQETMVFPEGTTLELAISEINPVDSEGNSSSYKMGTMENPFTIHTEANNKLKMNGTIKIEFKSSSGGFNSSSNITLTDVIFSSSSSESLFESGQVSISGTDSAGNTFHEQLTK